MGRCWRRLGLGSLTGVIFQISKNRATSYVTRRGVFYVTQKYQKEQKWVGAGGEWDWAPLRE